MSEFDDFYGGDGRSSFLLRGCLILGLVVLCLGLGAFIAIGAVASLKGVSPVELFQDEPSATATGEAPSAPEEKPGTPGAAPPTWKEKPPAPEEGVENPVVFVARKVGPSVVQVKLFLPETQRAPREYIGGGSGVIYRGDGYILTNEHVVGEQIQGVNPIITVVLVSGEELEAEVVGADRLTDLAMLKIDKVGLPAAEFTSTESLQIGDLAVAIGSPFGLEATVTQGVISAVHRQEYIEGRVYYDLIQTDAAINPGNSGGALSNSKGQVIGINTAILSPTGVDAGLGFAISSDVVMRIADQLIEKGKVSHPYMGIAGEAISKEVAEKFDLEEGFRVEYVEPGRPADSAGIREEDIITKVDDTDIKRYGDLIKALAKKGVGGTVTVIVARDHKELQFEVTLIERPAELQG
ncbi:serine protease Do [Candidatus Hakubella thermalkaliphila]|uniref:Serine protease Do n=1 Tax=Candidatus Hakubella thermalkaliphila TaxID=2754717 RepID=A0A6V8PNH2_9ACTN|nr:serine protease Do [Candidatus Hakubella thermalkaliphila]